MFVQFGGSEKEAEVGEVLPQVAVVRLPTLNNQLRGSQVCIPQQPVSLTQQTQHSWFSNIANDYTQKTAGSVSYPFMPKYNT